MSEDHDDPREAQDVCPDCGVGTLFEVGLDELSMDDDRTVIIFECEYCNHQVRSLGGKLID